LLKRRRATGLFLPVVAVQFLERVEFGDAKRQVGGGAELDHVVLVFTHCCLHGHCLAHQKLLAAATDLRTDKDEDQLPDHPVDDGKQSSLPNPPGQCSFPSLIRLMSKDVFSGSVSMSPNSEPDDALQALHRRLRQPLLAFFIRRVRDQAEAEDLVQEVFARMAANNGSGPELRSADAYVFQVAANLLRDRARRRQTQSAGITELTTAETHRNAQPDSERVIIARERLAEVSRALGELSERRRAIFLLSRLEGLQYHEIADMFGISVSAVKKHIAKTAAHLALRIGEEP